MKRALPSLLLLHVLTTGLLAGQDPLTRRGTAEPDVSGAEAEVFLEALQALSRMHLEEFDDSTLWEAALEGMIRSLGDPYAAVFTPREAEVFDEETSGNYAGIGVQITPLNERITITAVFRGTPANAMGLQVGDIIVGVDGDDATTWTTDSASVRIRGPVGTDVEVSIRRAGFSEPIPFRITRDEVHIPAVSSGTLKSGIGYVVLDRVARNAAREMDEALRGLDGVSGLIIDLRRNPGGYLDESLMLADIFLEPGSKLASTVQRAPGGSRGEVSRESYEDRWPARVPELPIVVLVDRFTASGAEILAGALQDYDRAVVLGERSFGKGVVQTILRLPHGRRLRFTTGSWHTPLGRSLHRLRDRTGRPLEVIEDTLPRVTTAGGRSLVDGGGIFPDVQIADDTLKLAERQLLEAAAEARVPLGLRVAEQAFEEAQARRESGRSPGIDPESFRGFLARLAQDGVPPHALEDPSVRDYLGWRVRMTVAQRMDEIGSEADVRMERDPVLAEAARLLLSVSSQGELLAAAESARLGTVATKGGSDG